MYKKYLCSYYIDAVTKDWTISTVYN